MEKSKHQCKLCTRSFSNGRALGGHMKAHLSTLPLPPKPALQVYSPFSSSFSNDDDEEEEAEQQGIGISCSSSKKKRGLAVEVREEKGTFNLGYVLRENPKKSSRLADPEFSFAIDSSAAAVAGSSVVLDGESETESRNPTRKRSKRIRTGQKQQKAKIFNDIADRSPEPVLSSVSDTSPEEDVAMCLMMLSRDAWVRKNNSNNNIRIIDEDEVQDQENGASEFSVRVGKVRGGKFRCEKCMKLFRSSRAMVGHKRICSLNADGVRSNSMNGGGGGDESERIFECPYCFKVFGSGQALGGHKRSHLLGASVSAASTTTVAAAAAKSCLIDLNLPAPVEDDEFSVVSDA